MRLRFFLWASADLGVRRSKVESSFCKSGYIVVSESTQAGISRPLDCRAVKAARDGSEEKLQCELHQPRIAGLRHLAELRSVRKISVRVKELSVIEEVEEFPPEIHSFCLRYCKGLEHREVGIADMGSAADGS